MRLNKKLVDKMVDKGIARKGYPNTTYEFDPDGMFKWLAMPVTVGVLLIGIVMVSRFVGWKDAHNSAIWDHDCKVIANGSPYFVTGDTGNGAAACRVAPNWTNPVNL